MNNIENFFLEHSAVQDGIDILKNILNKYNGKFQKTFTILNITGIDVLEIKKSFDESNEEISNSENEILDFTILYFLSTTGYSTLNVVNYIKTNNIMNSLISNFLKKHSYDVECAGNVYTSFDNLIDNVDYYFGQEKKIKDDTYDKTIINTLNALGNQMIRVKFRFSDYIKEPKQSSAIISTEDLRIHKIATEEVKRKYDIQFQSSVNSSVKNELKILGYQAKVEELINNGVTQVIFTGAPGTGKTYIAKEVAKAFSKRQNINMENKRNYELVQFHSSFDYTDFVEGLRPMESKDKTVDFRKVDGIFKEFCRKVEEQNIKDIYGSNSRIGDRKLFEETYVKYIKRMIKENYQGEYLNLNEPKQNYALRMKMRNFVTDDSLRLIEKTTWGQIADGNIDKFIFDHIDSNIYIYTPEILMEIFKDDPAMEQFAETIFTRSEDGKRYRWKYENPKKKYFFIIDEINRADLSKVLGELMYCFDKDKRGPENVVQTQYRNLKTYSCDLKRELAEFEDVFCDGFFIPENVVIVGTMNDIDRSVESMDFAMRRRFIFEEFFVGYNDLMIAFTASTFGYSKDIANGLAASVLLLNKYLHLNGEQYGLNSHYDISQGQFSDANESVKNSGLKGIKNYVWSYRIRTLLREYLRGENESEVQEFLDNAREIFDLDVNLASQDINTLSSFWNKIVNARITSSEFEEFINSLKSNEMLSNTLLWQKVM